MVGKSCQLVLAGALAAFASTFAQAPAPGDSPGIATAEVSPSPKHPGNRPPGGKLKPDNSPEMENVRKAIDALTPEQRTRFTENLWRWVNLSPEEKKALRDHEEVRKKFMEQELQMAIQESGLQLDGERRQQFIQRYGEERKKIEELLRKEMMEKRKPLVKELIARMKVEFSSTAPVLTPTTTPGTAK